jgi:hypothetical protein
MDGYLNTPAADELFHSPYFRLMYERKYKEYVEILEGALNVVPSSPYLPQSTENRREVV